MEYWGKVRDNKIIIIELSKQRDECISRIIIMEMECNKANKKIIEFHASPEVVAAQKRVIIAAQEAVTRYINQHDYLHP